MLEAQPGWYQRGADGGQKESTQSVLQEGLAEGDAQIEILTGVVDLMVRPENVHPVMRTMEPILGEVNPKKGHPTAETSPGGGGQADDGIVGVDPNVPLEDHTTEGGSRARRDNHQDKVGDIVMEPVT